MEKKLIAVDFNRELTFLFSHSFSTEHIILAYLYCYSGGSSNNNQCFKQ